LKEYVLTINGIPHTFLMDEDHAARVGAEPVEDKPRVVRVQLPPKATDKARRPRRRTVSDDRRD